MIYKSITGEVVCVCVCVCERVCVCVCGGGEVQGLNF